MSKAESKVQKRKHVQAAVKVQEAWIKAAGMKQPETRRDRDRAFGAIRRGR